MRLPEEPLEFIRAAVKAGRIRWTYHVSMRMAQRGLTANTLIGAIGSMEIIESYPDDKYLPSYLLRAESNGLVLHAHIAADTEGENVRIVTMYIPNPAEWSEDFRVRKAQ